MPTYFLHDDEYCASLGCDLSLRGTECVIAVSMIGSAPPPEEIAITSDAKSKSLETEFVTANAIRYCK